MGKIIDECGCCADTTGTGVGTGTVTPCVFCSLWDDLTNPPSNYIPLKLEVSGITDNACTGCTDMNGVLCMDPVLIQGKPTAAGCDWWWNGTLGSHPGDFDPCRNFNAAAWLVYEPNWFGPQMHLQWQVSADGYPMNTIKYRGPTPVNMSCTDWNTFNKYDEDTQLCDNWPSTMRIKAVFNATFPGCS